ncbi:MAG: M48 family metalloprotease, partial [Verrucomicrobia bacterium]|nr:M48 family metalloprotease [Verrucomicrobiota bacterium]
MKFVAKKLEKTADNSSGSERWRDRFKNLALVSFALATLYFILGFIADFTAMRISDETEGLIFHTPIVVDKDSTPPEFDKAKLIFAKLIEQPGLRKLPYQLQYMPDDEPNAFAVPGGGVIVTRGLLKKMTSPSALAFVLGHELGHHQHRHTLKGVGRRALISFTFAALFGSGGVITHAVDLAESQ